MMYNPCAKFGDYTFSRFGFIRQTDRQTDRQTHTDADERYTHATPVGVCNPVIQRYVQTSSEVTFILQCFCCITFILVLL